MAEHPHFGSLTDEQARNWIDVARVLSSAESTSKVSPEGRPWQEVLQERLKALGQTVSIGHLAKIRRAYEFLQKNAPVSVSDERIQAARVSAVEVADRLHRISPEQGKKALEDLLADEPVTYVELQSRYAAALDANPQKRSLRQLAWAARKEGAAGGADAKLTASPPQNISKHERRGPSDKLRKTLAELTQQAWIEGWDAATRETDAEIAEKDLRIEDLMKTVAGLESDKRFLESENETLEEEIRILAEKYKDLLPY